jgi:hypothetical protein
MVLGVEKSLVVRYLARAFVAAPKVEVRADTFADLARALGNSDLVPTNALELRADGAPVRRVALTNLAGDWTVAITGDSFDVTYTQPMGQEAISFADYCSKAAPYLASGLEFINGGAHRIAVVTEVLAPELSAEKMLQCAQKLLQFPPPFEGARPFEWDWRIAHNVRRRFGQADEDTNTLAAVKRLDAHVGGQRLERLFVSTDVNTTPRRTEPRFEKADIISFVEASPTWHAEIRTGLLTFLELEW